ncbi:deoxyuridine 5'-triphosphate nucleotidohydrolase [Buchnera aphidicola (Cinara tujafilina)]|uniref:Deoxyuridine 5'-triphosphate nucleotidohydrolase n=1 Tax=Buchnera aphidicola (Cinara tujafilina) TaxID=261317 RepID=F7WZR1_9GAMM|nr:deoxyuridine 5'-triphosphate nucleotidohydrolase [Buchnera aphidicola]AEH39937.1 deoxyuridine 5'-triphosphate nucleotidohydrolase [Buchnera aphidicola (Cinara tujafilina)]
MCKKSIINLKILDIHRYSIFPLFLHRIHGVVGLYLRTCLNKEILCISPNCSKLLSTGISLRGFDIVPSDIQYLLLPRSGLGYTKNIVFGNFIEHIKTLYEGELKLSIWNRGKLNFYLNPGEIIAHLVFISYLNIKVNFIF